MRIALIAMNASLRKGGESARPIHYARGLLALGHDVSLYTHARCRDEIQTDHPDLADRTRFVDDTLIQSGAWRLGHRLPERAREFTAGQIVSLCTQRSIMKAIRALPESEQPEVIHQVTPISPKAPSCVRHTGPVVIGPLNGDIDYPKAFARREPWLDALLIRIGRPLATLANRVFSGKAHADLLLVSNSRTQRALPVRNRGQIHELTANAVDLSRWTRTVEHGPRERVRLVFLGRLVRFKGLDLLLEAFAASDELQSKAELVIIGGGPQRQPLEHQAKRLGIADRVRMMGWVDHETAIETMLRCDAMVFPSLQDPGGAAVMEGCAMGLPVICADWAGPAEYLPQGAGLLVPIDSEEAYFEGLTEHMLDLTRSPARRAEFGAAARKAAFAEFGWPNRVAELDRCYRELVAHQPTHALHHHAHPPHAPHAQPAPAPQAGSVPDRPFKSAS
ncbi:MAG: glycosyltransferase involved in cell wall biosynthesis [Phycisphaerales bacterium]|jgi:glycosyltransferase involved in cell wall biosynthesis